MGELEDKRSHGSKKINDGVCPLLHVKCSLINDSTVLFSMHVLVRMHGICVVDRILIIFLKDRFP
jgi:hypothetical protein